MTMDDANSIYVGGLPYDIDDDALRHVFSVYGNVLSVKIVNDRNVRGKCYGFVTFSNRQSADDAIEDMDGKTIGGRAVRVNEVTTRGGRLNSGREQFQPPSGWDNSSDRRSDCNYERELYSDRSRERDRSQDRRKNHYAEKGRAYEHSHEFERRKDDDMMDRNGYKERVFEDDEGDWRGDRSYGDNARGINKPKAHKRRSQETKRQDRIDSAILDGGHSKDHFSNSSGDHSYQAKEEVETLIKMREVLQDEVLVMEDRLKEKEVVCFELQKKYKRLEDSLINEKKLTSQRRKDLAKLYKSLSKVRECSNNMKISEQELQSLVDLVAREGIAGADE